MVKPTEQDLLKAISKIDNLHACAEVLAKAFDILNDPDSNQMDLVEVIKTDTGLTSDILRISNSAFYGSSAEISSLDDAIHRLGFREVLKLISISMSKQLFRNRLHHYNMEAVDLWEENAAVAATMENFSDLLDEDRSYFFTLGILHSIGKLVIDQTLIDRQSPVFWDKEESIVEWETKNFGFDYSDAGHVLLTTWNFPQKILAVILNQLTPERVYNPPNSLMCLNFSIRWSDRHKTFNLPDEEPPPLENWLRELEVTEQDLKEVQIKSQETFEDLKKMVAS